MFYCIVEWMGTSHYLKKDEMKPGLGHNSEWSCGIFIENSSKQVLSPNKIPILFLFYFVFSVDIIFSYKKGWMLRNSVVTK